ncbi:hypothetical protein OSB04_007023 [Centaurea solstitialis]|uniref:Reverse transcriptase domain-containing protein n=1 Tax=Centaurea solstitialis TaxID=347529 RepID=A0AA38U3M8_9ASTR|nr:hypothetical protein OSB04_007023 [Centaurea solstitialis]
MLYGRRCRTPICWGEVGHRELASTEIVQKMTESIEMIQERLKTAQSRQKSYADKRRSDLQFDCRADESAHILIDDIQVDEWLNYIERPIAVLERKTKTLRNKEIGLVKVYWEHHKGGNRRRNGGDNRPNHRADRQTVHGQKHQTTEAVTGDGGCDRFARTTANHQTTEAMIGDGGGGRFSRKPHHRSARAATVVAVVYCFQSPQRRWRWRFLMPLLSPVAAGGGGGASVPLSSPVVRRWWSVRSSSVAAAVAFWRRRRTPVFFDNRRSATPLWWRPIAAAAVIVVAAVNSGGGGDGGA